MSVLIIGSVALDSVETPEGKVNRAQGGSASYASIASSYWCEPAVVAVIGDDYPKSYLKRMTDRGINIDGVEVVPGGKSFHWSGFYKGTMHEAHTRETSLGVFQDFHPRIPEHLAESRLVLLGNIDPELQLEVLDQLKSPQLVVVDTMNLWINTKRSELLKVLSRADIIVVNDGEARMLAETIAIPECARYLLGLGPKFVIVKKGENGAQLHGHDNYFFSLPSFPVEILNDPTGAGDSFAGGMLGYLSRLPRHDGRHLNQALAVGTIMASFCVEAFSVERTAHLTAEEIKHRLGLLHTYTSFDAVEM
jgi:sugar/nucleoside kinase (ribokinase family)